MFGLHNEERMVSYLPLSHVAAQITDIIGCIVCGATVWFAGKIIKIFYIFIYKLTSNKYFKEPTAL
jgi:long-subunit acyl-CoA synthetase (AMP-forming)